MQEVLPFVKFAINNHQNSSTGESPLFLTLGQHPHSLANQDIIDTTNLASQTVFEMKATIDCICCLLSSAPDCYTHYVNLGQKDLKSQIGKLVLLSTKDLKLASDKAKISRKFHEQCIGPFKIIA